MGIGKIALILVVAAAHGAVTASCRPAAAPGFRLAAAAAQAGTDAPRVVASIAPIHSLVAGVMAGVGEPHLIVRGYGSPHHYQMRPSEAAAVARADLVFWAGPALEAFLERPLANLGSAKARIVELLALDGLTRYAARPGGAWDRPAPAPAPAARVSAGIDPHFWLDAGNARRIVAEAVRRLRAADPANAPVYASNGAAVIRRIDATDWALRRRLAPVRDIPYVVAHDAFQYFERRYGLRPVGAITVAPDRLPGARRIRELRSRIAALKVRCVLGAPRFDSALIDVVVEGTHANRGTLDPIGAGFDPGADAYFQMMTANAEALAACLGGAPPLIQN